MPPVRGRGTRPLLVFLVLVSVLVLVVTVIILLSVAAAVLILAAARPSARACPEQSQSRHPHGELQKTPTAHGDASLCRCLPRHAFRVLAQVFPPIGYTLYLTIVMM